MRWWSGLQPALAASAAAMSLLSPLLLADGGTVQLRRETGALIVTVFTSHALVRAGVVDLSVMLQTRESPQSPVLDAGVGILLTSPSGRQISARPTHDAAQNKLFYAAPVPLTEPGQWTYTVEVNRQTAPAVVSGTLTVEPAGLAAASYWQSLAFPPVVILLFAIHQWRRKIGQIVRE